MAGLRVVRSRADNGLMSRDRYLLLTQLTAALVLAFSASGARPANPCAPIAKVYIPLATAVEPFGLRTETRAQFLDRVYGRGRWREGDGARRPRAVTETDGAALRIDFPAQTRGQVDLVVEAQIEEMENNNLRPLTGHRALATYTLGDATQAHLRVPRTAFRESGALLIVVTAQDASDTWDVYAWPIASGACEQRIYVRDRATAIRLMREAK